MSRFLENILALRRPSDHREPPLVVYEQMLCPPISENGRAEVVQRLILLEIDGIADEKTKSKLTSSLKF